MAFIILEGVDRSGKSSVAELYRKRGFDIVHMSTPDKKYRDEFYVGPSYLDEMIELYMKYDGKDVVFDRSPYGEAVWPQVFNRKPLLTEDDFEMLREFEDRNNVERILMIDPNKEVHWKRCVDNKEPLNRVQFNMASTLYGRMAHLYNFIPRQLSDYVEDIKKTQTEVPDLIKKDESKNIEVVSSKKQMDAISKLEKANAINSVLSSRIVKKTGTVYDDLEKDIRVYLKNEIDKLMGNNSNISDFSNFEVQVLKEFCKKVSDKDKDKKITGGLSNGK